MDTLPATALKVLGQFLDACDSYSCRLSSRCLSPVVSKEQSSSHIRVVANSFQHQLQQEQKKEQQIQQQQQQQQQETQQQRETKAPDQSASEGPTTTNDASDTRAPAADQGDTRGPRISEPFTPRSQTAASLARAAASFGYRQAHVYVDVLQQYQSDTWQQMFGALLSSHSLDTLVITEYSSSSLSPAAKQALEQCHMQAEMATLTLTPPPPAAAAEAAAVTGHWLPHLAAAYTAAAAAGGGAAGDSNLSLQHLDLQLPAPLPVSLQPLLLQLTGIKTLKLSPTRVWSERWSRGSHMIPSEPLLLPSVAAGLSALCSLGSLTCSLSASQTSGVDAQVATKLQQLFSSQVMSHLTHLDLGTSPRSSQLMLSAPLVSLHSLKSLTCQPGFYVDVEDAQECMRGPADATAAAGSGSRDVMNMPMYQIAPSLTRLVLNEGSINDHEQLLKLLVGKGVPATAAAGATTQLQHLEMNSLATATDESEWGPSSVGLVGLVKQLSGLRYFKTSMGCATEVANTAIAAQLLGLTILCTASDVYPYEYDSNCIPMPTVTNFTGLTSLAIHAPEAVFLNPHQHFKQLCALPNLKHFEFSGSLAEDIGGSQDVSILPDGLQSLVLRHKFDPYSELPAFSNTTFSVGFFPSSLTCVKFEGWDFPVMQEVDEEDDETSELHNLVELSMQVAYLHEAHSFLRHCSNLQRLSLIVGLPQPIVTSKQETASNSACTSTTGSCNAGDIPLLSKLCPNLMELHMKLENMTLSDTHDLDIGRSYPPADDVFSALWPEVTQLRGLKKLSLNFNGMVSHQKTLMPNLSALSTLSRLQHLTLGLVVHLDPPVDQCMRKDDCTPVDAASVDGICSPAAGVEAPTTLAQSVSPSIGEQQPIWKDHELDDLKPGPVCKLQNLGCDNSSSNKWPEWWRTVVSDAEKWLVKTLRGACSELRTLNVQASAMHAEDLQWGGGMSVPMSKCFRGQLLHSRKHVMFMEQQLPNCLV